VKRELAERYRENEAGFFAHDPGILGSGGQVGDTIERTPARAAPGRATEWETLVTSGCLPPRVVMQARINEVRIPDIASDCRKCVPQCSKNALTLSSNHVQPMNGFAQHPITGSDGHASGSAKYRSGGRAALRRAWRAERTPILDRSAVLLVDDIVTTWTDALSCGRTLARGWRARGVCRGAAALGKEHV